MWRALASHRLMASMLPLPMIKDLTQISSIRLLPPFLHAQGEEKEQSNDKIELDTSSSILPFGSKGTCHPIVSTDTSIPPSVMQTYRDLRKLRSSIRVFPKVIQGSEGGGEGLQGGPLIELDSRVENENVLSDSMNTNSNRIKISKTKVLQLGRESRRDRAALVDRFTRSILMNGGIV